MWQQLVIWVAMQIISALLSRSSSSSTTATPGDLEGTTVDASSPVPVLFGTRLIKKTNCVWYGDVGTTPIQSCGGGKK